MTDLPYEMLMKIQLALALDLRSRPSSARGPGPRIEIGAHARWKSKDMHAGDGYGGGLRRVTREFLARPGARYEIHRMFCDCYGHNATWNVDGSLRRVS